MLKLEQVLHDRAGSAPDRPFRRAAQVLHLLDQVHQIQFIVPTGAQKLRLALGPDVEVLVIEVLVDRLDPACHQSLQTPAVSPIMIHALRAASRR
jgi:hypothetical protein